MNKISYTGYRFPPEIIHQAIWLYLRFRKDWLSVRKRACVRVRGRPRKLWRRVRTLRPDDRSGPELASVRGRDWPAPDARGLNHVQQTQRHATCAAQRCVATPFRASAG